MTPKNKLMIAVAFAALMLGGSSRAQSGTNIDYPPVITPPDSFFEKVRERDRDVAREFYRKYIDVKGMPVVAAAEVADLALQRAYDIVTHMLAGRGDVLKSMVERGMYLVIIGRNQVYTDLPENRNARNADYLNERVRGTGGFPTSFGEENLLSLPIDRYDDESIAVHEFCHTIDSTLSRVDPTWRGRKRGVYRNAVDKGLFKDTYAGSNSAEYWAEIAQAYFDSNRVNNWNHGPIGRREQLKIYDPEGYELVRATFNLSPGQDWRYSWLQALPNVESPPAKFHIDSYYTKFTWAREFTVIGRGVSNEAMLKANDTIRKMFAYRHDILKALIADGVKLVVLGSEESLSDLPEYKKTAVEKLDHTSRFLDYSPELKLLVVDQENVLGDLDDPYATECQVMRVFSKALYHVTGKRPVEPNWEDRGRNVQQYELRVRRMDIRFDEKLKELYDSAMRRNLWKGTSAVHNRVEYWTGGVLAYFDAVGRGMPPNDAEGPITTREALEAYDPDLAALVAEVFQYEKHVDWRYRPVALAAQAPTVTEPPAFVKERFDLDPFYKKYIDYEGLPIMSSEKVSDAALVEARYIIANMLANRPDIRKAMIRSGVRVMVMSPSEQTTDVPEQRQMDPKMDRRARGLGGRLTSCGEENLLRLPGDRYSRENILIHEFAHCIHLFGLRRIDKSFDSTLRDLYQKAMDKGLFEKTYAAVDHKEYWAEGVQSWFDCNNESRSGKPDGVHNHVNTREELIAYDPELADFIEATLGQTDWRYPVSSR